MAKRPINSPFQRKDDIEMEINYTHFEKKPNFLIDAIVEHKKSALCKDCKWVLAVYGFNSLKKLKKLDKPCLRIFYLDLELVGNAITILTTEYGFVEDTNDKPSEFGFNGAVIVYCE